MFGDTPGEHHVGHRLDDAEAVDTTRHTDGQAFPIDQGHQAELATVTGLSLDKIVAPDMIAVLRPQPDAGPSFSQSRPRGFCFLGTFSPSRRQIR